MPRNNQVQIQNEQSTGTRIVDGVSSVNTYVVLATREGKRVAMRFLSFSANPVNESTDKYEVKLRVKIHLEVDQSQRTPISQRTPGFFGQAPENFYMHQNRATGVLKIPVAYLPINAEKLKERISRSAVVNEIWKLFVQPVVQLGGQPALTKEQLAEWMRTEMDKYSYPTAPGTILRQTPPIEIEWSH